MRTIIFVASKGGAGKSTLAAHVAIQAGLEGEDVTLADLDEQQTLGEWWKARQTEWPRMTQIPVAGFDSELERAKKAPGLLIVDTPGFAAEELHTIVKAVDFIVIPVQPSPNDFRAIGSTVRTVKQSGQPFCFVVSRGKERTFLTQQAPLELSQHGPVATAIVMDRTDYARAMADGRTVQEVDPAGKGAAEMAALWKYIRARMDGHVEPAAEGRALTPLLRESDGETNG